MNRCGCFVNTKIPRFNIFVNIISNNLVCNQQFCRIICLHQVFQNDKLLLESAVVSDIVEKGGVFILSQSSS